MRLSRLYLQMMTTLFQIKVLCNVFMFKGHFGMTHVFRLSHKFLFFLKDGPEIKNKTLLF